MRSIPNKPDSNNSEHGHYFLDISIENVRCFGKKQKLVLANENNEPHHWTIILGDNGVGKTSLLKSLISIAPSPKQIFKDKQNIHLYPALMDWREIWDTRRLDGTKPSRIQANTIAAHSFNKLDKEGILSFELVNDHKFISGIKYNEEVYSKVSDFLCFGYGASRKMGKSSFSNEKFSTASISLFDDEAPLINVEEFFMQADYEAKTSRSKQSLLQREKVKQLLIDILPEVTDLRIVRVGRMGHNVEVKTPFGWIKISEMSLGYKSLIAWIVDFASRMYHYHQHKENPFAEPAVVLIDEIDLHLHPKWQRKILTYLTKKFPNTQFIATAHSAVIVQAAMGVHANIALLQRKGSQVLINNDPEVIRNWRIDQVLTSDLFGLDSPRNPEVQKLMDTRKKILSQKSINVSDKSKVRSIEAQLGDIPEYETTMEREAYSAIDKVAELLKMNKQ